MRIRYLVRQFLLLILIGGCTLQPGLQATAQLSKTDALLSSTPARSVVITTSPSLTSTIPITLMLASTITPTNTPIPESLTPIPKKCLQIRSSLPQNKSYDGRIVFEGDIIIPPGKDSFVDAYAEVSFFDLKTRKSIPLQKYKTLRTIVSPDRTKYALLDVSDYLVKVFSTGGQLLNIISKGTDPLFIDRWLDNQQIELTIAKGFPAPSSNWDFPLDQVIANWLINERKFISSDYPDIDRVTGTLGTWDGFSMTEYDATLTRVVYRSASKDGYGYILWDTVNKKRLIQIVTSNNDFPPVWSPNYSKFIVTGQNGEMYIVTRDGEVLQMTHFNHYSPEKYSWSPDGRFVAFWLLSNQHSGSGTFFILDTVTNKIIDYCISTGIIGGYWGNVLSRPVWSPDGKYLAINANIQKSGNSTNFDTLFVDLEDGSATNIGENLSPVGWLINSTN
jgi:hypothetical protein